MINIQEMMQDPDLAQDYTVYRKSGRWNGPRWVETETPLSFFGPVIPADAKEIQQVPEGDRVRGVFAFYSDQEIFITHIEEGFKGTSDQISWGTSGGRYRIYQSNPFGDFGYWKAIGARMAGK
jgi:hypothetical protein